MKKAGRIKTYYGISVPPWRQEIFNRSVTLVFILTGRIPSKKNELVSVVDRSAAFKFLGARKSLSREECIKMLYETFSRIKNSKEYEAWELAAVETLKQQLAVQQPMATRKDLIFPLSKACITIRFYWKGKYRRDNSNKSEGIHDALVRSRVITDDSYIVLNPINSAAGDYTGEITKSMAVIYITTPIK